MTKDIFRPARQSDRTAYLVWMSIGVPIVAELAGQAGYDGIVIDQQHGMAGKAELIACLTAARASNLPALTRVVQNDPGLIGQALDAGAQGVICPMVNGRDDAERLVKAVKYPPVGERSYGPYGGKLLISGDYFAGANDWTIACGQIETRQALDHLEEILSTDGLDMILVGPNDLAISLSGGASRDIRESDVVKALDLILAKCREYEVIAGIFANDAGYAKPLIEKGWDVLTVGTDAGHLSSALAETLAAVRGS